MSPRPVPIRPGHLCALGYNCNRTLERQKSRGLSRLGRRSCRRCTRICKPVLSICSVRSLPNVHWDGCRLSLFGCSISSTRHVVIPRTRSSQFGRFSLDIGAIADWVAGCPYRRRFHLHSRLSRSILSKIWLSTGRLSCSG